MPFRLIIFIAVICGFFLVVVPSVYAVTLLPACVRTGSCTVPEMVSVIGNAAKILLGIVGSMTLLMFIYGGFVWLTSGGNPDKIKKGQTIIVQTVIGLAIVFGAYAGVHFLTEALGAKVPEIPAGGEAVKKTCESPSFCQDTRTRLGGEEGCEKGLCPGKPSYIMCCPAVEETRKQCSCKCLINGTWRQGGFVIGEGEERRDQLCLARCSQFSEVELDPGSLQDYEVYDCSL